MNEVDASGRKTGACQEPDPPGCTVSRDSVDGAKKGGWARTFAGGRVRSTTGVETGGFICHPGNGSVNKRTVHKGR